MIGLRPFYVCDPSSGRILRWGESGLPDLAMEAIPGRGEVIREAEAGLSPDSHYFVGVTPTERPSCPAHFDRTLVVGNGVDVAFLGGLPAGSVVTVVETEQSVYVNETYLELSFAEPGTYTIHVDRFPYLRGVYSINAT